ncbi:M14 family zinc carboxypeptidase [Bacteroidota bacterium]
MTFFKHFKTVIFLATILFIFSGRPCSSQITTPEDYLGFKPGADFHLANYEQAIGYFEKIAGQSDRMVMRDMGPTSEGRRMKYAIISSEENISKLDHYKEINKKLTLFRGVSKEDAEKLAEEGKVVVWIDCGLHASEASPAQHAIQLAYDIVTDNDRRTKLIRENVIFLLVFANPDGLTMVSDWYKKNVGTKFETSRMPVLYQKYAGHDNNRDSFIANLQEIQNMNRVTCREWFPEVLYNLHETAPFPSRIWLPPESEPMNPNLHPIIVRWKNLIGSAMGKAFEEANQPGAISRISFDSWYPGYVTQFVDGHNIPSILTETANFGYATPHYYTINDFPERYRDLTKGVFYPNPWEGGWWRLGDAVAYNLTASKSVLEVAAKFKYEFLYNKWEIAGDIIEKYNNEPPYGWIIPVEQKDEHTTNLMIDRCILNGIEVYTADKDFEHNGINYSEGSFIIPTSQPFGLYTRNMMEIQKYPDLKKYSHLWQGIVGTAQLGKQPIRAYDGAGWTLPIQMGVKYYEMSKPLDVGKTLIEKVEPAVGKLIGNGSVYVFSHSDNGNFIALNHILKNKGKVSCALEEFTMSGKKYPAGSFLVDSKSINKDKLNEIVSATGVKMVGGKTNVKTKAVKKNRIALYRSWTASMDAGWISYVLDSYEFPYHPLTDAEIRAGSLHKRFDVIILPDQGASSIINGNSKGSIHPDYVGGITEKGVENLIEFVNNGGRLVCNRSSCDLAIKEFRLPFRNILEKVKSDTFNCPGSLLKLEYKTDLPLAFGLPKDGMVYFSSSKVFEYGRDTVTQKPRVARGRPEIVQENPKTTQAKKAVVPEKKYVQELAKVEYKVVAAFPDESLLISGFITGDQLIRKKAAVLDIDYGKGNVVLFGFNVHNRAQSYLSFKLLFNSMIN